MNYDTPYQSSWEWKEETFEVDNLEKPVSPQRISRDGITTGVPSEGDMIKQQGASSSLEPAQIRATLFKMQLALSETDGLSNEWASAFSDAEFFVREAIDALNRVLE